MKWPAHGSNPHYLYEAMKLSRPAKTIDFSANINPYGPPRSLKESWHTWLRDVVDYPDPYARTLTEKLAAREQLKPNQVVVGNGGAELISLIARQLRGKKVLIIQPAFSEYEEACRTNQCEIHYYSMNIEQWTVNWAELYNRLPEMDAVFLCNPNNPTGVFFPKAQIEELAAQCEKHSTLLIVDEAFYDFVQDYESTVPLIKQYQQLVIIRSMTKMFAIPGLRLGYLIANEAFSAKIRTEKPHWSVNAIALKAGELCLDEHDFVSFTLKQIKHERNRLKIFYEQNQFNMSPTSVNFYLLQDDTTEDQLPFFFFLLKKGIVARHTMNFPGIKGRWLRLAVKSSTDHDRLLEVVTEWRNKGN